MPLFEYECSDCKARFEQLVYNTSTKVVCKKCGGSHLSQLLSTFAVAGGSNKAAAELGPCGACGAAQRGMCGVE